MAIREVAGRAMVSLLYLASAFEPDKRENTQYNA